MGDIKRVKKAKAIHRISVVDQVSEAIKQNILDHVWNVGDKIPSESELADEFEVIVLVCVWHCKNSVPWD